MVTPFLCHLCLEDNQRVDDAFAQTDLLLVQALIHVGVRLHRAYEVRDAGRTLSEFFTQQAHLDIFGNPVEKVQHLFRNERVGNARHHPLVEPSRYKRRRDLPGILDPVLFQPVARGRPPSRCAPRTQIVTVQRHGLVKRRERVAAGFHAL